MAEDSVAAQLHPGDCDDVAKSPIFARAGKVK